MRLEVRRHSLTKKGRTRGRGSHLSAEVGPVGYVGRPLRTHLTLRRVPRTCAR